MTTSTERRAAIHTLAETAASQTSGRSEYVTLIAEILNVAAFFDGHDPKRLVEDAIAELVQDTDR